MSYELMNLIKKYEDDHNLKDLLSAMAKVEAAAQKSSGKTTSSKWLENIKPQFELLRGQTVFLLLMHCPVRDQKIDLSRSKREAQSPTEQAAIAIQEVLPGKKVLALNLFPVSYEYGLAFLVYN